MYDQYPIVLAVAAFIKNKNGRLLIIKKSLNEQIDPGLWTVPGGKVMPEEPIINALHREIEEEVGIHIDNYKWIGEDVFSSNDRFFHAQHFLCKPLEDKIVKLEKKMEGFAWISKKEMNKYDFPVNIKKRLLTLL